MNQMKSRELGVRKIVPFCLVAGLVMGCSSAPEPQPEPSKKEVQQDADHFFEKVKKEEAAIP